MRGLRFLILTAFRFLLGMLCLGFGLGVAVSPLMAQDSGGNGQFCVRAFDDRNGNGQRDGEPTLSGGVSANLLDANDIVIASAILDDSPTASTGIICFQGLAPAQYTIVVASGDYHATTPDTLTATLREDDLPAVLEFGAQRIGTTQPQITVVDQAAEREAVIQRLLLAVLGALVAVLVMSILGLLIYVIFVRRRRYEVVTPPSDAYYRRPTSENPQVHDTGEFRR